MTEDIVALAREAGVVGAGGAGFPTHVKLAGRAEVVLANGASCEPLLLSDPHLLEQETASVLEGLRLAMARVGAGRGVVCLKGKHQEALARVRGACAGDPSLAVFVLDDFYPAGDEHVLVHEVTGRVVPEAGLPIAVGVLVQNVETLRNLARAREGWPVVERFLTVAGEVKSPCVLRAPLGLPAELAIAAAGGPTVGDFRVIDGGPMMGRVLADLSAPVTKTTSGLLVLPAGHNVVAGKAADPARLRRISAIACCQCTLCTELCPRYLLGHGLHPHKLMRSLNAPGPEAEALQREALLCSECGVCEKFACPMLISPREVNGQLKRALGAKGVRWTPGAPPRPRPERSLRKVPTARLLERLDLAHYAGHFPFRELPAPPPRVRLPLRQHIGAPAEPVVREGQRVARGELVGRIPEKALGAAVHASLDGVVESLAGGAVSIVRG